MIKKEGYIQFHQSDFQALDHLQGYGFGAIEIGSTSPENERTNYIEEYYKDVYINFFHNFEEQTIEYEGFGENSSVPKLKSNLFSYYERHKDKRNTLLGINARPNIET